MIKKSTGILLGVGAVAIVTTAIAVPLSLKNNEDTPKKALSDAKIKTNLALIKGTAYSSKLKVALNTAVGTLEANVVVTNELLGITDPSFTDGVTVAYVVKTKYDDSGAGVIVVTATLSKGDEKLATKEIIITAAYNFATILEKIKTGSRSTKDTSALIASLGTKKVEASVTSAELGFEPKLPEGVTVAYVVKKAFYTSGGRSRGGRSAGRIDVTATLTKGSETSSPKTITIWAA